VGILRNVTKMIDTLDARRENTLALREKRSAALHSRSARLTTERANERQLALGARLRRFNRLVMTYRRTSESSTSNGAQHSKLASCCTDDPDPHLGRRFTRVCGDAAGAAASCAPGVAAH
jgi:hypothetical protein